MPQERKERKKRDGEEVGGRGESGGEGKKGTSRKEIQTIRQRSDWESI